MIKSGKYVEPTYADFPSAVGNKGALAQALDNGGLYHSDGTNWNTVGTINSTGSLIKARARYSLGWTDPRGIYGASHEDVAAINDWHKMAADTLSAWENRS